MEFEKQVILKSLESDSTLADIINIISDFLKSKECKGTKKVNIETSQSGMIDVSIFRNDSSIYFLITIVSRSLMQLSSMEGLTVKLLYSNILTEPPFLIKIFNKLKFTPYPVDVFNIAQYIAEKGYFQYRNKFEEVILCAPQIDDWYYQRNMLVQIMECFFRNDNACCNVTTKHQALTATDSIYVVSFEYKGLKYLWIDCLTGTNVYCSHLECIERRNVQIIYASDDKQCPFIPRETKALSPMIVEI